MSTKCDDCQMDFNSESELAFDNETGIFSCPNCGSKNIVEITEIDIGALEEIK